MIDKAVVHSVIRLVLLRRLQMNELLRCHSHGQVFLLYINKDDALQIVENAGHDLSGR